VTVAKLRQQLLSFADREPDTDPAEGTVEDVADALTHLGELSLATFAGLLRKVKIPAPKASVKPRKPAKTPEQLAQEKITKEAAAEVKRVEKERVAAQKAEAGRVEKARKAEQTRLEKERKAAEVAEQKRIDAPRIAEQKRIEKEQKAAAAAEVKRVEKARKAEQTRLNKERREAAKKQPTPAIIHLGADLNDLIARAKREQATYDEIDEHIDRLKPLTKPQLLQVATLINSNAGLSAKPKAEIVKRLGDTLRRVLGTAERVKM